jgi:hypothetical protein
MYANNRFNKVLKSLKGSFLLTGSEIVHIKQAYQVISLNYTSSPTTKYTELGLLVDAVSYTLKDGKLEKENITTVYFTVDTSQVIKCTEDNIALLMLDSCSLVRSFATDWYKKRVS